MPSYSKESQLRQHIKRRHEGIKPKPGPPAICSSCGVVFKKKDHLKRHMTSVHEGIKKRQYRCGHCSTNFVTKKDLINHIIEDHEKWIIWWVLFPPNLKLV